jgi:hypothetical protein
MWKETGKLMENTFEQKLFAVVYYSGQSVRVYGDSLEQVTKRETAIVDNWKLINKNPNLGIAAILEVIEGKGI